MLQDTSLFKRIMGSVHTHTEFSGTKNSVKEVSSLAKERGLKVLIFTDYSDRKWQYRFGLKINRTSILSRGVKGYLSNIAQAEREADGLIILTGTEASPFYYWEGNYFAPVCRDYNRHILVLGLSSAEDYENLPLINNGKSGFSPFSGSKGALPYQRVINYADDKGAVTFWAHPEQDDRMNFFTARLFTPPYPEVLKSTYNYTGFSVSPRGSKIIPQPGGYWDEVLNDYCMGKRLKPVWCIGESDYREESDDIANPTTVFVNPVNNKEDVLTALRSGKIYALDSPRMDLFLNYFGIKDEKAGKFISMGDTLLSATNSVTIRVDIESKSPLKKVVLVRNGEVIKESKENQFEFIDNSILPQGKIFYRLMVKDGQGSKLFSNPVFLKREENT